MVADRRKFVGFIYLILLTEGLTASGSLIGKFVPQKVSNGGSTLNIINQPSSVLFTRDSKPIAANEITSILSLALGFSVPKEISWKGLLSGNPFEKPDAVLMVIVDSLPTDQSLKITTTKTIEVENAPNDEPRAELLSLSGIRTLSSHLSEIYDGKAYTMSLSANEDLAAAGYSQGENSQTVVWSEEKKAWLLLDSKNPKEGVVFTKDQVLSEMENMYKTKDLRYDPMAKQIIVKMKTDEVKFDLQKKADFLFFSELTVAKLLYSKIASNPRIIKDGTTDAYMIGISSLQNLQKKYGSKSPQITAAISVLEKFIPEITEKFVKLYNGNILAVELSLTASDDTVPSDLPKSDEIYHKVKNHLDKNGINDFYIKFQELHVSNDIESHIRKSLCEQMSGVVSGFGINMKFKCADGPEHRRISRSLLATKNDTVDVDTANLASIYDADFPVIFNLWFWSLVALFLAVYVISLVMWYMDPGRDSIIYRMTSQRIKTE